MSQSTGSSFNGLSSSTRTSSKHDSSPPWLRAALAAGGAVAALDLVRRIQRSRLPAPSTLPKALTATARTLEHPRGRMNYYVRPGRGTPIVLLHSFNAAASPFEMQPLCDRLARTTDRPIYALDWLGFGRSSRGPADYTPSLYEHQLYHFLTEAVPTPADLVALSLGSEIAARTALQAAPLVRRLALIAPTGLSATRGPSTAGKAGLKLAAGTGAFELLFYILTRRASLRRFYARQVFLDADAISDALVDYAYVTAHARGAHRAPQRFVEGALFTPDVADTVYTRLYRPTLLLTPETPGPTVQRFDRLPDVLDANPRDLTHHALPGGLLPHWEAPEACFEAIEEFLGNG